MGGYNILYPKCFLDCFVYVCFAMSAHHSCYINCHFYHGIILLFVSIVINIAAFVQKLAAVINRLFCI